MSEYVKPAFDTRRVLEDFVARAYDRNRGYPSRQQPSVFDANSLLDATSDSDIEIIDDTIIEDSSSDSSSYEELQKKYGNQLDNILNQSAYFPKAGTILGGSNIISGMFGGPTYGQGINWLNEAMGRPGEKLYDMFGGFNSFEEMNEYYKNQGFQDHIRKKNYEKLQGTNEISSPSFDINYGREYLK